MIPSIFFSIPLFFSERSSITLQYICINFKLYLTMILVFSEDPYLFAAILWLDSRYSFELIQYLLQKIPYHIFTYFSF